MVIRTSNRSRRREGVLMVELLVAIALLAGAFLPLAYSIATEKRYVRAAYQRAVAMELVDGEMEVLAAGAWKHLPRGTSVYPVHADALTNLPPGQFTLTVSETSLRLEWKPIVKHHGGPVAREFNLR